jgi:hypothetical protein
MLDDSDRQELLKNERFLTSLLAARQLTASKPWWESQGLWATIGALVVGLTTIVGNYITQDTEKTREIALSRQDSELKQNRDFLIKTASLVGRVFTAMEDELDIAAGTLDAVPKERTKVHDRINAVDKDWRDGQASITFLFQLYYSADSAVPKAWEAARHAVADAWKCSDNAYLTSSTSVAQRDSCSALTATARAQWEAVATLLASDYARRVQLPPGKRVKQQ